MQKEFLNAFAIAFLALFPILNPPAMAPIFFEMTSVLPEKDRKRLAWLIGKYTFYLLFVVLIAGGWLLKIFGISIPVIRIAGGILLFNTAWRMLNDAPRISPDEQEALKSDMSSKAFFPLTMPITAGPGTIAVTLTLVPSGKLLAIGTWINFAGISVGIVAAALTVFIFYKYSGNILIKLGKSGIQTCSKLSAFILLTIGVEIIWEGVQAMILSIK